MYSVAGIMIDCVRLCTMHHIQSITSVTGLHNLSFFTDKMNIYLLNNC